jgi:hypothetical protein
MCAERSRRGADGGLRHSMRRQTWGRSSRRALRRLQLRRCRRNGGARSLRRPDRGRQRARHGKGTKADPCSRCRHRGADEAEANPRRGRHVRRRRRPRCPERCVHRRRLSSANMDAVAGRDHDHRRPRDRRCPAGHGLAAEAPRRRGRSRRRGAQRLRNSNVRCDTRSGAGDRGHHRACETRCTRCNWRGLGRRRRERPSRGLLRGPHTRRHRPRQRRRCWRAGRVSERRNTDGPGKRHRRSSGSRPGRRYRRRRWGPHDLLWRLLQPEP